MLLGQGGQIEALAGVIGSPPEPGRSATLVIRGDAGIEGPALLNRDDLVGR